MKEVREKDGWKKEHNEKVQKQSKNSLKNRYK